MSTNNHDRGRPDSRRGPRVHSIEEISVHYEGRTEEVAVRPPDVSLQGMFFNTTRIFPEGSVLNLKFRLALSGAQISTRCEVRYCLRGIGVGVEFIGLSTEAAQDIEREIRLSTTTRDRKKTSRSR